MVDPFFAEALEEETEFVRSVCFSRCSMAFLVLTILVLQLKRPQLDEGESLDAEWLQNVRHLPPLFCNHHSLSFGCCFRASPRFFLFSIV